MEYHHLRSLSRPQKKEFLVCLHSSGGYYIGSSLALKNFPSKTPKKIRKPKTQNFSQTAKISVLDDSGLINPQLLAAQHITTEPNKTAGITAVKNGQLSAFFYYPQNPETGGIQVYAQDQGFDSATYNDTASGLLMQSVANTVNSATGNSQAVQILEKAPAITAINYKNGAEINDISNAIAPGIFAAAFFLLVALLSFTMISSTSEEKANKTAEILLTSIKARTLIIGKIVSLLILGFVQIAIFAIPLVGVYLYSPGLLGLPANLPIPVNPVAVTFAALFFIVGLIMYTGFMVGLGAMFPGGNEASRFLGVAVIWNFIPIYALSSIIVSPHALAVTVFTYFPLTAPTTTLLRNAFGSLSVPESLAALAVLIASAFVAIWFAVRAFRYGSMEYGRRVGLKELLRN